MSLSSNPYSQKCLGAQLQGQHGFKNGDRVQLNWEFFIIFDRSMSEIGNFFNWLRKQIEKFDILLNSQGHRSVLQSGLVKTRSSALGTRGGE